MADVAAGSHKRGEGFLFFFFAAIDGDVDERPFAAGVEGDLADVGEGDARVGELALDHGGDFVAKGPGDPVLVVFARPFVSGMANLLRLSHKTIRNRRALEKVAARGCIPWINTMTHEGLETKKTL